MAGVIKALLVSLEEDLALCVTTEPENELSAEGDALDECDLSDEVGRWGWVRLIERCPAFVLEELPVFSDVVLRLLGRRDSPGFPEEGVLPRWSFFCSVNLCIMNIIHKEYWIGDRQTRSKF